MASVFACWGCGEYHVCDGSSECTLIETHEGVVCALTGNYMGPHFQPALRPWTEIRQDTQDQRDKWEPEQVQGLVKTVVNHLYHYFLNENVISGVSEALFDQEGALRPHIPALVSFVFPCCLMLFRGPPPRRWWMWSSVSTSMSSSLFTHKRLSTGPCYLNPPETSAMML